MKAATQADILASGATGADLCESVLSMKAILKRVADFTLSVLAIICLSPLLLVIAVTIRLTMGSPVIFGQLRAGYLGRAFYLFKFRSMDSGLDAMGRLLPDGQRLTRLGKILRRYSVDELPQLWNVLIGDMSLVGPRPLLLDYLPRYSEEQSRRHEVKPGITGWAQINGRNSLEWEDKFQLDVWYVDHWSLGLDFWIVWRTLLTAFREQGVSRQGHPTMPEFMGKAREGE